MTDAAAPSLTVEAERLRNDARGAYKAGQYDRAIRIYSDLIGFPENAIPVVLRAQDQMDLGTALVRVGRISEALEPLKRARELSPRDAAIVGKLGRVHTKLERHEEAAECYRRLTELNPGDADGYGLLGTELRWLGRDEEARGAVEKALELDPDHIDARLTLMALDKKSGTPMQQAMAHTLEAGGGDVRLLHIRADKPPALWALALQAVALVAAGLWLRHLFP